MATIYDKLTAIADSIREKTGKTELLTLDDMAYEISTISGGLELNFNIKRYSSEEELLADTPSENTIGIISDIEITGYQFSATEPENMNEGAVWINTSTSSVVSFDIIDGVTIYPTLAKQYVSGTWVDKTAYIYQSGEWVDFVFYLFSAEKGINKGTWNKKVQSGYGSFSVDSQKVYLVSKEDNTNYAVVAVNDEPINTTGKSKLIVSMTISSNVESTSRFGLSSSATNTTYNSDMVTTKTLANGDLELDISELTGIYYFKVWINSTSSKYTATCTITEIKVE